MDIVCWECVLLDVVDGGYMSMFASDLWDILSFFSVFFFNDTATTEIYTLSLHDALPI